MSDAPLDSPRRHPKGPNMADMKARARELADALCGPLGSYAEFGHPSLMQRALELIAAALDEARIAGLREATSLAEGKMSVLRCPYAADKPGDPTWDHTDDDVCPVCHKSGNESLHFCVESKLGNFRAAIDARIAELTAPPSDPRTP